MENKEIKERLVAIYNALIGIKVEGEVSVCNMAGCIQIVKEMLLVISEENSQ